MMHRVWAAGCGHIGQRLIGDSAILLSETPDLSNENNEASVEPEPDWELDTRCIDHW
jgi:hypothetical protein